VYVCVMPPYTTQVWLPNMNTLYGSEEKLVLVATSTCLAELPALQVCAWGVGLGGEGRVVCGCLGVVQWLFHSFVARHL
jgi:hypothetical protein